MMRAVYIGTFQQRHVSDNYRLKGMEQAGIDTIPYDYRSKAKYLKGYEQMNAHLIRFCILIRPDFILINKGELIEQETIRKLKEAMPKTVMVWWYGDQRGKANRNIASRARDADLFLINNTDERQKKEYMGAGVKRVGTWHSATDPDIFKPVKTPRKCEVTFIGGNYAQFPMSRMRLELVREMAGRFNAIVYGGNWPQSINGGGYVFGGDFSVACSGAEIVLGINAYDNVREYTSNRTWNTLATGSLFLTHYFKGMEKIFGKSGDVLVNFQTVKEAIEIAESFLRGSDKAREAIGKRARKFIMNGHTYAHRAVELIRMVERCQKNLGRVQGTKRI